jgi:histidine triad (HIT) family protein
VAELVDARDSKSRGSDTVSVRVRPSAPFYFCTERLVVHSQDCIFCKIIRKEIPTTIVYEDELVIAMEDLNPKAPTHYLILPKKHVESLLHIEDDDAKLMWHMAKAAKVLGEGIEKPHAFNIISNNGAEAGQSVFHMHWHFLAGRNIYDAGFSL